MKEEQTEICSSFFDVFSTLIKIKSAQIKGGANYPALKNIHFVFGLAKRFKPNDAEDFEKDFSFFYPKAYKGTSRGRKRKKKTKFFKKYSISFSVLPKDSRRYHGIKSAPSSLSTASVKK